MLSLTPPIPKFHRLYNRRYRCHSLKPFASFSSRQRGPPPPPPPAADLYQPFRPPPSPLPEKYRSLDLPQRIDILRDRLGLWHEYAPLISSLSHDGFTPPTIEELTGISSVDQNRLIVAFRVRDSLSSSAPDLLPLFDPTSAADLLYELRFLNSVQRASAARYALDLNFDAKSAQELARAIKDFPRRRGDNGWDSFSGDSPADCLAFTHFRMAGEAIAIPDKLAALGRALEIAETDNAKQVISKEIDKVSGRTEEVVEDEISVLAKLPVVRLRYGEVAEASSVVLLPVCKEAEGFEKVREAPEYCRWEEGELGVVEAEKGWKRWMVLPGWAAVLGMGGTGGVAVEFPNARVLPSRLRRWEEEEGLVVVVDRKRRDAGEDKDDCFYMVVSREGEGGELAVERGSEIGDKEVLGAVVTVVRPPKEEDDQLADEDWD